MSCYIIFYIDLNIKIAPFGYVITLNRYEMFDLEPSDQCEYDYLEVKDGPFGKKIKKNLKCN